MRADDVYRMYVGIKTHFTNPKYHYGHYNGKVRASRSAFDSRTDHYFYQKIHNTYPSDQIQDLFVANFLVDPHMWIGDIADDIGKSNYLEWQRRTQGFLYYFDIEVSVLSTESFKDLITATNGEPSLLRYYRQGKITLETFMILNHLIPFFPLFDEQISETIVWPNIRHKCEKYWYFLPKPDFQRCKMILKKHWPPPNKP